MKNMGLYLSLKASGFQLPDSSTATEKRLQVGGEDAVYLRVDDHDVRELQNVLLHQDAIAARKGACLATLAPPNTAVFNC